MPQRVHQLDARPENLFWGYFDAATPQVLEVESGDEVALNCLPAATMEDLPRDRSGVLTAHLEAMRGLSCVDDPFSARIEIG